MTKSQKMHRWVLEPPLFLVESKDMPLSHLSVHLLRVAAGLE